MIKCKKIKLHNIKISWYHTYTMYNNYTDTRFILSPLQLESVFPCHHIHDIIENVALLWANGGILNFRVETLLIPTLLRLIFLKQIDLNLKINQFF